jgi:predicted double-glycine peptidase
MQAWSDPIVDYTNNFDDGHFVVAIGYDLNYIYFEDPWILGSIAYIPRN